jgi:hypothetical protein
MRLAREKRRTRRRNLEQKQRGADGSAADGAAAPAAIVPDSAEDAILRVGKGLSREERKLKMQCDLIEKNAKQKQKSQGIFLVFLFFALWLVSF